MKKTVLTFGLLSGVVSALLMFATVFFALMDRFWSFITDKIYTF